LAKENVKNRKLPWALDQRQNRPSFCWTGILRISSVGPPYTVAVHYWFDFPLASINGLKLDDGTTIRTAINCVTVETPPDRGSHWRYYLGVPPHSSAI
jgi:hypothetical protein